MHFVFVERGYPRLIGEVGGASIYVKTYGNELIKKGHYVSVICGKYKGDLKSYNDNGINVYPDFENHPISYFLRKIPILKNISNFMRYLENGLRIRKILKKINSKNKIDLVEFSEGGDFWTAFNGDYKYFCHLHGSAYIFKKYSGKKIYFSDWLQRKAETWFIKRSSKIISPSNIMVDYLNLGKNHKKKVSIIPYPIKITDDLENRTLIEKKDMNITNLFFASRNDPIKGGDLLIKSVRLLEERIKNKIVLNIFGYQPQQNIKDLKFIRLHKFVSREKIKLAYKESDICIIPSIFDNSPNTVYEAMLYSKIIIASDAGGIPEIIGGKGNGYLFKSNDKNDLALKIKKAFELINFGNPYMMRKNAFKRISNYASLSKNIKMRLALV